MSADKAVKVLNGRKHLDRDDWHLGDTTGAVYSSHKMMTPRRAVDVARLYETGEHGIHLATVDVEFASRPKPDTPTLADEVAGVLAQLDDIDLCGEIGDVFTMCRERLHEALDRAKGES